MAARRDWGDYVLAAGIALGALAVSPPGIALMARRPDLSFRINAISIAFVIFLLTLLGAVLARGRLRTLFLYLTIWVMALPLLAALEAGAIALNLAQQVMPIEDLSSLKRGGQWPPYMLSEGRWAPDVDGARTYKPWNAPGITINDVGLRTAPPTPKAPGEWRIAMTGGSTVFGWRVFDGDTLPALLQQALRRKHPHVSVYNFGVEAATLANELALLKRFQKAYEIDEVLFYTGGNDMAYFGANAPISAPPEAKPGAPAETAAARDALPQKHAATPGEAIRRLADNANSFELVKTANRLAARFAGPSGQERARIDQEMLPDIIARNALRASVQAADRYCAATTLRCTVVLQPTLLTRRPPRGGEAALARNVDLNYPHIGFLGEAIYRDALALRLQMPLEDWSSALDSADTPFFVDLLHLNEAGNAFMAKRLAERLSPQIP